MTREEAIDIIGHYDVNFYWISGEHEGEKIPAADLMEAFDMAIEALRQEPCEDAISRADVLDLCDSKDPDYCVSYFKEDVECLPAVMPICEDAISREAVFEMIKDHSYPVRYDTNSIEQGMTLTGIKQVLRELSAVTPIRPKGRWIWKEVRQSPSLVCSNCLSDLGSICPAKYCPTCGSYNGDIWRNTRGEDTNEDFS